MMTKDMNRMTTTTVIKDKSKFDFLPKESRVLHIYSTDLWVNVEYTTVLIHEALSTLLR